MKKAAVCLKDHSKLNYMKGILKDKGLTYVSKDPQFVIAFGGDGSLLYSERKFPGVPKLLIKDSKRCNKCVGDNEETVLDLIRMNAYEVKEAPKIEAVFNGDRMIAMNDIVIRNKTPNQAIRMEIWINGHKKHEEFLGDGLVISTPYGSTAYFKSITRTSFDEGIGIAFNNPIEEHGPVFLEGLERLKVKFLRGSAQITADNDPKIRTLKQGETISVGKAKEITKLISIKGF